MTVRLVKQRDRFSETVVDGEVVVLNLDDGTFFSLTGTAAAIWALIDGERSRDAMLAELAADYEAEVETIAPQLDAFVTQLKVAGFVTLG